MLCGLRELESGCERADAYDVDGERSGPGHALAPIVQW